jgi:hypothetical protein
MPVQSHLLQRAYQLINANQLQNAELVLDAVVRVDPQNIEAWMTYLRIHQNQNDLDWLKERVLKTKEINEADKLELVNYYHYLTQHLNNTEEITVWTEPSHHMLQDEMEETITSEESSIRFELIDVFDYPKKIIKNDIHARSRRRAIYNPFTFDIASRVLKVMSFDQIGKKITAYFQKVIALANKLVINPKNFYAGFSKSPHFEKSVGIALLTLFVVGVRLVVSRYSFGYLLLGMFAFGSGWWLMNFGNRNTAELSSHARAYHYENNNNLPEINEVQRNQEQISDEENLGESVE